MRIRSCAPSSSFLSIELSTSSSQSMFRLLSKRCFHGTGVVAMGRKTGATALEPVPRSLSKKQKRRKVKRLEIKESKIDPKKDKIRDEHLKEQMASPQVKEFIEKTENTLLKAVRELMLPEGADAGSISKKSTTVPHLQPIEVLKTLRKEVKASFKNLGDAIASSSSSSSSILESSKDIVPAETQIIPGILYGNATFAAVHFAKKAELDKVDEILQLMERANAKPDCKLYTSIMASLSRIGKFDKAQHYFDRMVKNGVEPNEWAWSALVYAKARKEGPESALQTIDQLKKMGAPLTGPMFTSVLQSYVSKHRNEEAYGLWMRMHEEAIDIPREAFTAMLKYCAGTGQSEKAFFFMDEMRTRRIEPDIKTFILLFRACAEAPHWVDGYHDIIFDAMSAMEGAEMKPTAEIYNTIIYAFARAGDPAAAEYYYWEMQKKGLKQDLITYNNLLYAYSKAQSVGLRHYGTKGRYVKPSDPTPTEDEQAYMDAGATKVAEMMSKGIIQEVNLERGSRQKRRIEDLLDDDPDAVEAFDAEVRQEAAANRARRLGFPTPRDDDKKLLADDDDEGAQELDFAALAEDDEELRKLMAELDLEGEEGEGMEEAEEELSAGQRQGKKATGKVTKGYDDVDVAELGRFSQRGDVTEVDGVKYQRVTVEDIEALTARIIEKEKREEEHASRTGGGNDSSREAGAKEQQQQQNSLLVATALERAALELSHQKTRELMLSESDDDDFSDPFEAARAGASNNREATLRGNARVLTDILDGGDANDSSTGGSSTAGKELKKARGGGSGDSGSVIDSDDDNDNDGDDDGIISLASIAEQWDIVEFGRAPPPDYSLYIKDRQKINTARARKAFKQMQLSGIKPDVFTLTSFMSVFAEAQQCDEALKIFRSFDTFGLAPNANAFRVLIKMYIREKDIDRALAVKNDMLSGKSAIVPDGESYGLLVESMTHREMIVEGLKLLEEATAKKVTIPERHIKFLRARCSKLGIKHPDMPENPNQWIKDAKNMRRAAKRSSDRKVEPLRGALYG